MFITWWNDHYDEVAHYEPEYERLNQIMKWSLLIGWLNESNHSPWLSFLESVSVDRGAWFPEWVRKHPELRYQAWDRLQFYPSGYLGTTTEAMGIVFSEPYKRFQMDWQLSGGVSLGSKDALKARLALPEHLVRDNPLQARAGIDFKTLAPGERSLTTTLGAKYTLEPAQGLKARLTMEAKPGTLLRGRHGDLAADLPFARQLERRGPALVMETKAGEAALGSLRIEPRANGFAVKFRARDLDYGHSLGRKLSRSGDPAGVLARESGVEAFVQRAPNEFYVKQRGADRWLHLAPETEPQVSVGKGWQSRIADTTPGAKTYNLALLEQPQVETALQQSGYVRVQPSAAADQRPLIAFDARGPPAGGRPVELVSSGFKLQGSADAEGNLFFKVADLPPPLRENLSRLPEHFGPRETAGLRAKLLNRSPGKIEAQLTDSLTPGQRDLIRGLEAGDPAKVAQRILVDVESARVAMRVAHTEASQIADALLAEGRYSDAAAHLERTTWLFRKDPQLQARLGLARIGEGQAARGRAHPRRQSANRARRRSLPGRDQSPSAPTRRHRGGAPAAPRPYRFHPPRDQDQRW